MQVIHEIGSAAALMPAIGGDLIQKIGSYAGFAAVVGLAVLAALYFSQARDVKRLREWAGRAPERSAEIQAGGRTPQAAAVRTGQPPVAHPAPPPSPTVGPAQPVRPAAQPAAGVGPAQPVRPAAQPDAQPAQPAKPEEEKEPAAVPAVAAAAGAAATPAGAAATPAKSPAATP
ncbi:MAG TPA: hypothetical protein VF545_10335, partial [Thermoleophilaceae bacterium]